MQSGHPLIRGPGFDPWPLPSTCWSVLGQDTELQIAPMLLLMSRWDLAWPVYECVWRTLCFKWSVRLKKCNINEVYLPFAVSALSPATCCRLTDQLKQKLSSATAKSQVCMCVCSFLFLYSWRNQFHSLIPDWTVHSWVSWSWSFMTHCWMMRRRDGCCIKICISN